MVSRIEVGVIGKHPGYGDFVRHGIDEDIGDELMAWIDTTLTEVRDQLKADWADFWDNGQELRFWLGRGILGKTTIGIFVPSRDRVGRRYPLLLMAQGVAVEAPVIDRDQRPWDILSNQLRRMQPGQGAAALLRGVDADALFVSPEHAGAQEEGPVIWAHHPEGNLDQLLASAAPVDHGRAATTRSYWWSVAAPGRAPVWLAHPGLPQGSALAWAIGGVPMDGPVPVPEPAASAAPPAVEEPDPFADIPAAAAPEPMPQEAFHSAAMTPPHAPAHPAEAPPAATAAAAEPPREIPVPSFEADDEDTTAAPGFGEVTDYNLELPTPLHSPAPPPEGDATGDDWANIADSDLPSLAMPRDDKDPKI